MKRPFSSDSMAALIPICPVDDENIENDEENSNPMSDFQTAFRGLEEDEECGGGLGSEKKRRLGVDQVKALEKNFEVESKLDPERKVKLAGELGLQPRQVAVWFQNRRARWKTKQLEKDCGALRANHDALKLRYQALQKENQSLLNEIKELKSEINVEDDNAKEDAERTKLGEAPSTDQPAEEAKVEHGSGLCDVKGGSPDGSDSSTVLNNDGNNNTNTQHHHCCHHQFLEVPLYVDTSFQFVKIEEDGFMDEESCSSLFSDDQAPTLHWDDWK